jgi:2-polyprenyl-3-methyl-5-hydroxy-6-metoxy-1,4-benzoquinol methylase
MLDIQCPICNNINYKLLYELEKGQLIKCKNCDVVFYTPQPTPEELTAFYNSLDYREYYLNSAMTEQLLNKFRYKQLIEFVKKYAPHILEKKEKFYLDIGCGEGDLLKIAQEDNWNITGTEIALTNDKKESNLLNNSIMMGDLLSLNLPENYYDLITIYHVIEHLIDPIATLQKIRTLLKPDGIAFIETPNIGSLGAKLRGKKWSHIIPPEHIIYFDNNSLKYALKTAEFSKYFIFTNAPYSIESVINWIPPFKSIVNLIYKTVPILGLGASLQAVVFK